MAIAFPRVPEVESGDPVTSSQLAALADAINARIVSGLGDCAPRIAFYWLAAARQFRIPNVDGSYPPQAEFFTSVQMLGAETDVAVATPGNYGGVNTGNLTGLYVYGQGSAFPSEKQSFGEVEFGGVPTATVTDAEGAWELAKQQRGTVDAAEGAWAAPAFDAARHVFRLVYGGSSVHGNAYGGFLPSPAYLPDACTDGSGDIPNSPNYEIFFTNTETGEVESFDGTCTNEPTHIAGIWQTPIAFWVVLNNGEVTYLDRGKWIEGPYSAGNVLRKTYGEHLPRILNAFVGEFRGGEERERKENEGKASWLGKTFNVREFMTRPNYLSPARGQLVGEEVMPIYPTGSRTTTTPSVLGSHNAESGFWFASAIIRATNLRNPVSVSILSEGVVVGTATLSPTAGNASSLVTFTKGAASVEIRLLDSAPGIGSAPTFTWELAEVYALNPGIHDLWTVMRLSAVQREITPDGTGPLTLNANELWENWVRWGCITRREDSNEFGEDIEERQPNTNAVFDKFRRMSRVVRCLTRQQVKGYAVEGGNSILWVSPFNQTIEGLPEQDTLAGIRDAIAAEAEPGGYANEWVAFPRFTAYHPSPTSLWDRSSYSDWFPFSDRCAFYAPGSTNIELRRHFNAADPTRVNLSLAPEAVSGYRYSKSLNSTATEPFYKSCRLYEPPLKITSAETVTVDGEEQVKITFDGRFHHHDTLAPTSIDRDISTWDLTALLAEEQDYRTDENAIRAYLAWKDDTSRNCERTGPGNAAAGSSVQLLPDNPYGTCFPHIWLVQLLSKPYDDGNDRSDKSDTPIRHDVMLQAETYIRAMCEGFVDGQTSKDYGCAVGVMAVFDYTFPNLCFDAFGGTSITTMPTVETDALDADEVRTDSPIGYGPLPTVRLSAEQWNQFARAVNKLTRVRVALPYQLQILPYDETNDPKYVAATAAFDGSATDCSGAGLGGWRAQFGGGGITPTTTTGVWIDTVTMSASNQVNFASGFTCSGGGSGPLFLVENTVHEDEYRFSLVDPDAENALPSAWRDMLNTNAEMVWSRTYSEQRIEHTVVAYADGTLCEDEQGWEVSGGFAWRLDPYGPNETSCEILPATGRLQIPEIGTAVLYGSKNGPSNCTTPIIITDVYEPVVSDALILRVPFEDEVEA